MAIDKLLLRSIQNQEAFGGLGRKAQEPLNMLRELNGLPLTTPEGIKRVRSAMMRLSKRRNHEGWLGKKD